MYLFTFETEGGRIDETDKWLPQRAQVALTRLDRIETKDIFTAMINSLDFFRAYSGSLLPRLRRYYIKFDD